ncbi:DUF4397 domain-containing protein [Belliella aquatica]|uniref:DUF4397 domain-containing protein n=1 Tax=Belliella aquatica TaxID=1323734 RepID=A0ABQ1MPD1_9BACT|nr:DUF4397 domain-containing protein [Belliella aquatica]MCH7406208.1 DUF4397 domain-containing protein [Belliella aquatica]GGC44389.1 hypothetical protein GCM10010993_23620 [Belliella aquatica]
MITTMKMKHNMKTVAMLLLLTLGFGLAGCLDDNESTPIPPAAFISIYHGSPDAPNLDVFANSNRVTTNPFRYAETLPYSRYYLGERTFKFSPYNSVTSLLEKTFTIEEDVVYSMFFTGMEGDLDAILLTDEWATPNQASAQLRFVHLSPDAGLIEVQVEEGDSPFVDNSDFKTHSNFEDLDAGTYNIRVVSKVSGETLVTANNVELRGNRVYTLVLRGLQEEGTEVEKRLNLQLITNFINF